MFKHEVTYTDFNDKERTETLYFNISKAEIIKLEAGTFKGKGFSEMIQEIIDSEDNVEIIKWFSEIIKLAYGKKSDDGIRFEKSDEIYKEFEQSPAYDEFFTWLISETNNATVFVNGIMPKGQIAQLAS
jgi:hypothetical protein